MSASRSSCLHHVCIFKGTITLILATDMARHGEILDSFKQKVDSFDYTDEEHMTCVRTAASFPLPVSFRAQLIRLETLVEMLTCVFSPLKCHCDATVFINFTLIKNFICFPSLLVI